MTTVRDDIIPEDWSRWNATKPRLLETLPGGLTNTNYLLATDSGKVVLRLNSTISDALNLNRVAENQALRRADSVGLCAPLVYTDPGHRYLVTRYIEGRPWRAEEDGALVKLATLLQQVHQLPPIDSALNISDKIASYLREIPPDALFSSDLQSLAERIFPHIAKAETLTQGICLTHNDLLPGNLLVSNSGRLYAIDWEYAATSDPFYDLAVLFDGHQLNTQQQSSFLEAYLNRPATNEDWQRLGHWQIIYRYLTLLWYGVQQARGSLPPAETLSSIKQQLASLAKLLGQQI